MPIDDVKERSLAILRELISEIESNAIILEDYRVTGSINGKVSFDCTARRIFNRK